MVYNSKDYCALNSRNKTPLFTCLMKRVQTLNYFVSATAKNMNKSVEKMNNNMPEMIINLLWLMHSTGVYKAVIIQYLRQHADKLHPISVWNPCAFVLVCVRALRCFIWFSAQSYPIITVCAQPMNTLPLVLLIQMYVRQSGCLWRTEGGALTK